MEIPKSIDITDEEVLNFLDQLTDYAFRFRIHATTIIKHWDELEEARKGSPRYYHVNK
jgi:hypothetical protein